MTDAPKKENKSSVVRLYEEIKEMAISYSFKPGERVNEVELAKNLGASRTPLREALNRLVAEGFLTFVQGRGFFCRELKSREIYELYQMRTIIEVAAVRLACEQAADSELQDIQNFLDDRTSNFKEGTSNKELVAHDEEFHHMIMALTRNSEMSRLLGNVYDRIKFFRWIDMDSQHAKSQLEHADILKALIARDAESAAKLMENHIRRRLDQITEATKEGYSRIYMHS